MLWAQRVVARKGQPAHVLLEIRADSTPEQAQAAFHKIARASHPDLHRHGLTPEELEIVTSAYAACAGAYQTMRSQVMQTARMKPLTKQEVEAAREAATTGAPAPATNAAQSMSSKALVYYRKAELCLKRGDLKGALLQLKLAIAADPSSALLRSALAEVDLEVRKT